jgi:predicted RNA binding protein YcfA (HicA-like mRNA interferase family)
VSPRIAPVHWKVLECVFLKAGFAFERQSGDHRAYVKPGCLRPVIIPTYKEVDVDIILANLRTANLTRNDYFLLLKEC